MMKCPEIFLEENETFRRRSRLYEDYSIADTGRRSDTISQYLAPISQYLSIISPNNRFDQLGHHQSLCYPYEYFQSTKHDTMDLIA
jgi:hypothetical protein